MLASFQRWVKVLPPGAAEATPAPAAPKPAQTVLVRYSHYNQGFPLRGGRLNFRDVDAEYSIAFAFPGEWSCALERDGRSIPPDGGKLRFGTDADGDRAAYGFFSGLEPPAGGLPAQYALVVTEDAALADAPRTTFVASGRVAGRVLGLGGADALSGEDSSSCSCLYGNPCASPYNCADWAGRFDVARRNGWKGFG